MPHPICVDLIELGDFGLTSFGAFIKRQGKQDDGAGLHQVGGLFYDGRFLPR